MAPLIRVLAGIGAAVLPLLAQQAHVNLDWAPHRNTQNLRPFGAALISPEVRADRRGREFAGLSMGGRHAQLAGFRNANPYTLPKLFR